MYGAIDLNPLDSPRSSGRLRHAGGSGFSRTFDDSGLQTCAAYLVFPGILGRCELERHSHHQKCGRAHIALKPTEILPDRRADTRQKNRRKRVTTGSNPSDQSYLLIFLSFKNSERSADHSRPKSLDPLPTPPRGPLRDHAGTSPGPSLNRVRTPKHIPPAARPDSETVQDAAIGDGPVGANLLTPGGAPVTDARADHKLDHDVPCP